jgi:hypothetical protein
MPLSRSATATARRIAIANILLDGAQTIRPFQIACADQLLRPGGPARSSLDRQVSEICRVFVAKCVRDMPRIAGKTGHRLTPAEQTKINLDGNRILIGAQLVSFICRNDLLGTVTKPVRTRDPYGIGQRYATWLDPLIDKMLAKSAANSKRFRYKSRC